MYWRIVLWLCVNYMILHGVWSIGYSYPDQLVKSRSMGRMNVICMNQQSSSHIISKSKVLFSLIFIYINIIKQWHKKNHMIDRCMWTNYTHCDPSHITLTCGLRWYDWGHNSWSPSSHTYQSYDFLLRTAVRKNFYMTPHQNSAHCP